MYRCYLLKFVAVLGLLVFISTAGNAQTQSETSKVEVGAFVTTLDLNKSVGEKPLGIGGRFSFNLNKYAALDSEIAYYPQNPSGNFGETQALIGVKAGVHIEKVGVFAKFRPGIVHFGGDDFKIRNGQARNNFALDVGGVLEYYPTKRFIVRLDIGDTIIPFGSYQIKTGAGIFPNVPGTTHNLQTSFGIGYKF